MGRRPAAESVVETDVTSDEQNGDVSAESRAPLTSAQRLAASTSSVEIAPDPFGLEAKHFTEFRVLNREVNCCCWKLTLRFLFFNDLNLV